MKRFLIAILICAVTASCTTRPKGPRWANRPREGSRFIATVDGLDKITHAHVGWILKSHGLDFCMAGSGVYGISVPRKDYTQAVSILKEDLKKHHYNIIIHAGGRDIKYTVPEKWSESSPNKKHQELLGLELYKPTTNIGALLRSPEVRREIAAFPYVVRIKSLRRKYLKSNRNTGIGHKVKIELVVKLDEDIGSKSLRFQVWDNGKQIQPMGSTEGWYGEPAVVSANRRKYDKRKENTEQGN